MGATAKRAIDELIASSPSRLVPTKVLAKIEADLRAVVKAETEGRGVPANTTLADFFAQQYKVSVSESSVRRWLGVLRRGKSITR